MRSLAIAANHQHHQTLASIAMEDCAPLRIPTMSLPTSGAHYTDLGGHQMEGQPINGYYEQETMQLAHYEQEAPSCRKSSLVNGNGNMIYSSVSSSSSSTLSADYLNNNYKHQDTYHSSPFEQSQDDRLSSQQQPDSTQSSCYDQQQHQYQQQQQQTHHILATNQQHQQHQDQSYESHHQHQHQHQFTYNHQPQAQSQHTNMISNECPFETTTASATSGAAGQRGVAGEENHNHNNSNNNNSSSSTNNNYTAYEDPSDWANCRLDGGGSAGTNGFTDQNHQTYVSLSSGLSYEDVELHAPQSSSLVNTTYSCMDHHQQGLSQTIMQDSTGSSSSGGNSFTGAADNQHQQQYSVLTPAAIQSGNIQQATTNDHHNNQLSQQHQQQHNQSNADFYIENQHQQQTIDHHYEQSYHSHPLATSQSLADFQTEQPAKVTRGRRGRPRKKKQRSKSKVNGKLWEFIRDLLLSERTNPSFIRWERREDGVFKFVQSDKVAKMWGERKQNPKMTYEKLSRAMRYYYKSKVLLPVFGRRLVYKFGPNATGWLPNSSVDSVF